MFKTLYDTTQQQMQWKSWSCCSKCMELSRN